MGASSSSFDVVVIGGGFAGVVAARDLSEQGAAVLLLEARDHLGGRTWTSTFPETDTHVDMGGHFIVPDRQPAIAAELRRYAVETDHIPAPESYPTILAGTYNPGPVPVPIEQIADLERAAIHCQRAAARIQPGMPLDHQDLADLDIPLSQFLAPLELPVETYEFVTAVAGMYSFRYPEELSALHVLTVLACFDLSAYTMWGVVDERFKHGSKSLLDPIAAGAGEIRLDCPVARVDQSGERVLVTTVAGEAIDAAAVVVAVPMNNWNDIEFVPELGADKRASAAEFHGTKRSAKAWVRTRNGARNPFVVAAPQSAGGAFVIFTEREFENGDQLMAMFGYASLEGDDYSLDFKERESVERTLATLVPGAELVSYHSHDYNSDPFSKGDWVAWKPGRLSRSHSVLAAPEGRLAFATADIATKWFLWIEGAVESGHRAALQVANELRGEAQGVPTP
jgi:monoamine oxidase